MTARTLDTSAATSGQSDPCFSPSPSVPLPDLIHCTNEMNVNIPQLADTLFERTANSSWVVVFKALITTHHLMMYGNEVGGTHRHTHTHVEAALLYQYSDLSCIKEIDIDLHIYISISTAWFSDGRRA